MTSDKRAAADAWLRQLEEEDAAPDAPLRTDALSEVLGRYGAGMATRTEIRYAVSGTVARIEHDYRVGQEVLAAWHHRGDTVTHDNLWRAACWCQSAAARTTSQGRAADFAKAREILDNDLEVSQAATNAFLRRVHAEQAARAAAPPRKGSAQPQPLAGSWERF